MEKTLKNLSPETLCIHAGYEPKNGEARVLPIIQSTTYKYDDADEVGKLFDLEAAGHMYSRISNPTVEAFENKIAALEGGVGALATSSGQAANMLAILTICNNKDHFIALSNLYGGSHTLFTSTLKKFGIEVSFVSPNASKQEIEAAIRPETKLIFGETIGNPGLDVMDIEHVAAVAHEHGLPLVVDNTFPTPYLCRPIDFGADIVTHSTTKYLDGHAIALGGVIVDSGKFDWTSGRFAHLTEEDPSYHGLSYTKQFGNLAYITKARVAFLRDMGTTMSPFNAFLTHLGTETLAVRMDRHSSNALRLAEFLESHEKVAWVNYPLLPANPNYERAKKYLPKGASGVVSFGVKGGVSAGKKFINSVRLASLVVHLGDLRTHVLHPASMTHRQLTEEQQIKAGVRPDGIRLSVGIEAIEDLIADLDQALRA